VATLESALARPQPEPVDRSLKWTASTAVILRRIEDDLEVLLIRRTERVGDPWSGHIAFPGGRSEAGESPEQTATRETHEEVGLDLEAFARILGRLPPRPGRLWQRLVDFQVTPIVYLLEGPTPPLRPDPREVADTRWAPLSALAAPRARSRFWWWMRPVRKVPLAFPVRLARTRYEDFVVWGLTQETLDDLLDAALPGRPK
jgi:8-oxo-dGTP pyrophosphatase MutT (NUDIX family)